MARIFSKGMAHLSNEDMARGCPCHRKDKSSEMQKTLVVFNCFENLKGYSDGGDGDER